MLLMWKYINKKSSPIRKCMIEHCFLNNSIKHLIGDVIVQCMLYWRMLLIHLELLFTSFQRKLRLLFALKIQHKGMFHASIYAPIPVNVCFAFFKIFSPLENVWKYISYSNNNYRLRKRQLWMQPCHTLCPGVSMLFRIHFLINKIASIIPLARYLLTKLHFYFPRKIQQLDCQLMLQLTFQQKWMRRLWIRHSHKVLEQKRMFLSRALKVGHLSREK